MSDLRINLKNKTALITGGYGYLGTGMVRSLLAHDAKVYVLGRSQDSFDVLFKKTDQNQNLFFRKCDVNSTSSIQDAFASVLNHSGKIDILVNNAFSRKGPVIPEKIDDVTWLNGIDSALGSVFRCSREVIPFISDGGRIINISTMYGSVSPDFSIYDNHPSYFNPVDYGAGKAGVIQLTRYFANYLGERNITVNCISPGPFPNPEVQKQTSFMDELKQRTALRRIGTPDDIGGICVFLASNQSSYITGQNFHVDGGWTSR